ncbi:MAG: tRNA (cmo5U34)-methyltransferase [Cellvibrionaceae bacterium]|jgi:tRNA (cmo5U34)-methyltransferase
MTEKSTVEEIRHRFDNDVERFSVLQTGQSSTVDAPFTLEIISAAAAVTNPDASHILDVGCGAGNYTLKLLEKLPNIQHVDLIDLSRPMLDRATERIQAISSATVTAHQTDMREIDLGEERLDVIMAAATLHHLRTDAEWEAVFSGFYRALKPGGSFWVSDLLTHDIPALQTILWGKYGDYLTGLKDEAYRDHVFNYVGKEDSPRPMSYQMRLLDKIGFSAVEILHKNTVFGAYVAIK